MILILDTNILVSALVSHRRQTPPDLLLDAALLGRLRVALSAALFSEWLDVTSRPRLQRFLRVEPGWVRLTLERLAQLARWTVPASTELACPDPTDQHLWDLLAAEPDVLLVTGERELLESEHFAGRVLTARQSVERLQLN